MDLKKQKYVFGKLMTLWTPKEEDFLKNTYATMSTKQISETLDKSPTAVGHKAVRLGLKKSHWITEKIQMTDREIGYIAASIDGEGSLSVVKGSSTRLMPLVQVINTDLSFLKKLQKITGGPVIPRHDKKAKPHWKQCYVLLLNTLSRVYPVLNQVVDEMTVKKEQALLLLEFCESRLSRENQCTPYTKREKEIRREIMKLNRRRK